MVKQDQKQNIPKNINSKDSHREKTKNENKKNKQIITQKSHSQKGKFKFEDEFFRPGSEFDRNEGEGHSQKS